MRPPPQFRQVMVVSGLLGETFGTNHPTPVPLHGKSQVLQARCDKSLNPGVIADRDGNSQRPTGATSVESARRIDL